MPKHISKIDISDLTPEPGVSVSIQHVAFGGGGEVFKFTMARGNLTDEQLCEMSFRLGNGAPDNEDERTLSQQYYFGGKRSLSVEDIVSITRDGVEKRYECASVGWRLLNPEPEPEPESMEVGLKVIGCAEVEKVKVIKLHYREPHKVQEDNAVALVAEDADGYPWATLTSNLVDSACPQPPKDHTYLKTYSENEGFMEQLIEQGVVSKPKTWVDNGFGRFPLVEVLMGKGQVEAEKFVPVVPLHKHAAEAEHCPRDLRYYSLDEVAETISGISTETYAELWEVLGEADEAKAKPMGGDGSDGTTEEPIVSDGQYSTDLKYAWSKLSLEARINITEAATQL